MAQYWGLPPEINAIRLTTGPGAAALAPMIAAYTAAGVAHGEQASQIALNAATSAAGWEGLGGAAMMAAATPKVEWHTEAGAHASTAVGLLGQAAGAHATATAATIPYPVVIANRMREVALESTNFLGINTPAIIQTNAEYGEYWAQNASAMTAYQTAGTAVAMALSVPLRPPVLSSNPLAGAGALAGLGMEGAQAGLQGATQTFAAPAQAVGQLASSAPTALSAVTAGTAHSGSGTSEGDPTGPAPALGQPAGTDLLSSGQSMMGTLSSAPQMLSGMTSPLSQLTSAPQMLGGQLSSLMGPAMSGLGGGPGSGLSAGAPGSALASSMSGVSGSYSGGGSPMSAALTKTASGGPVGLPGTWWGPAAGVESVQNANTATPVRAGTSSVSGPAMGPMAMPAGPANARRDQQQTRGHDDTALSVAVPESDAIPVLTSDGLVYADAGG